MRSIRSWSGVVGFALLSGCSPGGATPATTPTTVAIAAPTSAPPNGAGSTAPATDPPTTALTTLTAAATTTSPAPPPPPSPPPTTVVPPPEEAARVEIEATLNAFNTAIYDCYETPVTCDVDAVLDTYFAASDDHVRLLFRGVWQDRVDNNQIKISDGRIERKIVSVTSNPDGTAGTSYQCEVDHSFNIPSDTPPNASTTVPPELTPDYIRLYFEWERQTDNTWKITHSEFSGGLSPGARDTGGLPSLTDSEIDQCE